MGEVEMLKKTGRFDSTDIVAKVQNCPVIIFPPGLMQCSKTRLDWDRLESVKISILDAHR
jgi:hypothetical protein